MFGGARKSALLIDFDNVLGMTNGEFASAIAHWMAWLEDGNFDPRRRRRSFVSKRVYWNPLYERYRGAFEAAGFQAFACRAIAKEKKSSADIVMTLDAIDIANETRGLKEIVLLTSDTDFVPVVNRLQDRNIEVAAMGNEENATAAVYREYADFVVLRSAFREAFGYVRPVRRWFGKPAEAPAPAPAQSARASKAGGERAGDDPLRAAAERVVHVAKGALGSQVSRQSIIRALQGVPGFATNGPNAWLGQGSYQKLMLAIARARRKELRVYSYRNGGVAISYLSPDENRNGSAG